MTRCDVHDGHDCAAPLACLRAAVQLLERNAERNDRTGLADFPIVWPNDERWEVAA